MDNILYSFTKNADASIIQDANEFANYLTKKIGLKFFATCSNGILTIRPGKPHEYNSSQNEIEQFKRDNSEYRFMKGVKHIEPTSVNYTLLASELIPGISLRLCKMLRKETYQRVWNYLKKFKHRFIKFTTIVDRCCIPNIGLDLFLQTLQNDKLLEFQDGKVKLTSNALKKIPGKLFNQAELDKEYIEEVKLKAKAKL